MIFLTVIPLQVCHGTGNVVICVGVVVFASEAVCPPREKTKPCGRTPEWGKNTPHTPRSAAAQVGDGCVKGVLTLWAEIKVSRAQGSRAANTIVDHSFLGITQEPIVFIYLTISHPAITAI